MVAFTAESIALDNNRLSCFLACAHHFMEEVVIREPLNVVIYTASKTDSRSPVYQRRLYQSHVPVVGGTTVVDSVPPTTRPAPDIFCISCCAYPAGDNSTLHSVEKTRPDGPAQCGRVSGLGQLHGTARRGAVRSGAVPPAAARPGPARPARRRRPSPALSTFTAAAAVLFASILDDRGPSGSDRFKMDVPAHCNVLSVDCLHSAAGSAAHLFAGLCRGFIRGAH